MEVKRWSQLLPESQILFFMTKTGQFMKAVRELKEKRSHIQLNTEYTMWIRDIIGRLVVHTWRRLGGLLLHLVSGITKLFEVWEPEWTGEKGDEETVNEEGWKAGGDPLSDRERRSSERERRRRRGLGGTEVGVVTEWVSVCVSVCTCVRVCGRTSSAAVETARGGLQFLVLMGEQPRDVSEAS